MIRIPAGILYIFERIIPTRKLVTPKITAKRVYWKRFLLMFLDAAAGIETIATVKSPPTNFTASETTTAIKIK